ncbi:MAG: acyl-CoA thioesterase [Pseudomonadota bacterium]
MKGVLKTRVEVKVPFHDVDPAGIAWHGHYFKYLELARCALLERVGYSYREMADSGYVWPLSDARLRFVKPALFDQPLIVEAALTEWEYRLQIDYRIRDVDGTEMTRGTTVQVPVKMDTREMVMGVPDFVIERIEAAIAREEGE